LLAPGRLAMEANRASLPKRAGGVKTSLTDKKLQEGVHPRIMRPKKIILCVDDNEQELSVLKFMLATNGYRVISACNGQDASASLPRPRWTWCWPTLRCRQMNGCQLVERLKQIAAHVPMILLGDPQKMGGEMHSADALLAKKNCSPQELLERIKVMSARKRGPARAPSGWLPWLSWR